MGIRSLAANVRAECLRTFERGARLAGASHLKGLPAEARSVPSAQQALDVVEFDGHRLDVRLKVVVRDPLGFEQEFEIERIWLLVIIDVCSRAVLGYHVSLNRENSRYDVIRTIENALAPHRPRQFTLPGIGYAAAGGFPSGKLSELGYATWQWFKLDNAKANLAADDKNTGALIYGPSRIGKTRAIEYLRLAMAQNFAKVTTYHVQAEHKPKHAEGPFFTSLLEAVGCPEPDKGSNPSKRLKLIDRIKDACARNGSGVVAMFFDEAQRYGENEYEWLRDVHDHLDRINIRLFTFLIGQEELHAVKTAFQQARKTQIVARLMVEELRFHGLRDPADTATCLDSYDTTCFPRGTDWTFTRFFIPNAVRSGYRLAHDAQLLWNAFEEVHNKNGLPGELEIPMESFARAVEIMLKSCWDADAKNERPDQGRWVAAVKACGYVQARLAVRKEMAVAAGGALEMA